MYYNLRFAIVCLLLSLGAADDDCFNAVLNRRTTFTVETGQSLSLSCVVQHCGDSFTGIWLWKNSTDDTLNPVQKTDRHRLTREDLSTNQTRLILDLLRVSGSDEGSYGCNVQWDSLQLEQGHFMFVNVTEAVPSERSFLYRILACAGAILCLVIVLGLLFCLRSKVTPQVLHRKLTPVTSPRPMPRPSAEYRAPVQQSTPQPPPRRHAPQKQKTSKKTPHQPQQKTEVVYADISQDALLRQQQRVKQSQESTVYSSVRFM